MCGLVGMIAKTKNGFNYRAKNVFETMLFIDTLRGDDSTGIYGVTYSGNVEWCKEATEAPTFLKHTDAKEMLGKMYMRYSAIIGHNRKATKGVITDENAHPFVEGNTILVHNGTLHNHATFTEAKIEVDSHAMTHLIAEKGIKDAIPLINGAFAIICYDVKERKIYVVRNSQRPLFRIEYEDCYLFASEAWIAIASASREGFKVGKCVEVKENTLFTYDLSGEEVTVTEEAVEVYKRPFQVSNTVAGSTNIVSYTKKSNKECLYKTGDVIVFKPTEIIDNGHSHTIISQQEELTVTGYAGKSIYTAEDIQVLRNAVEIVGTVTTSYISAIGKEEVYVKDMNESNPIVTRNGIILDEEYIWTTTFTCNQCKVTVQEEELEFSYVNVAKNGKIRCVCSQCTEKNLTKNPLWGGIRQYEKACSANV